MNSNRGKQGTPNRGGQEAPQKGTSEAGGSRGQGQPSAVQRSAGVSPSGAPRPRKLTIGREALRKAAAEKTSKQKASGEMAKDKAPAEKGKEKRML